MPISITANGYAKLLTKVKKALVEGQARVEAQRVKTYWETGRIIHADILKHKDRAAYGAEVVSRLSEDLKVEVSTLKRCIQFAKAYPRLPIGGARHQFTWTHYRKLITVSNDKLRARLEKSAAIKDWSTDELAARIKEEKLTTATDRRLSNTREEVPDQREGKAYGLELKAKAVVEPLTPLRGTLYTYQITKRPTIAASLEPELLIDLGFSNFYKVKASQLSKFSDKMIVESKEAGEDYKFLASARTAKDLYTYQAFVERVIDGDTLKVRLDLGFDVWAKQILRLRGIDCPEMDTKEGTAAKAFVQSYIKEASRLIIRSSKSDKYDRYLADVFIPNDTTERRLSNTSEGVSDQREDVYLNNLLLENGYAQRWE